MGAGMVGEDAMRAALQAYIDGFNAQDAEAIIALFAEDAQIKKFYRDGIGYVTRMELSSEIRGSHSNAATMAFDGAGKIRTETGSATRPAPGILSWRVSADLPRSPQAASIPIT